VQIENDAVVQVFNNWTFRFRPSKVNPTRLLLMLHGWTGDENSMWVFSRNLPHHLAVLAPRAPIIVPEGGYSWREIQPDTWGRPKLDDLCASVDALLRFVDEWPPLAGLRNDQMDLIGFSQGAALSYTLAILYPDRVRAIAALSGFLPEGVMELLAKRPLDGKAVYITHGRQDDKIPVAQARSTVDMLQESGAQVTYCESDGGHKVDPDCFNGLADFFS
jgi:phospholipase/carboxylesterase